MEISDQIMPFLVQLSANYTEYEITVAISLVSKYSKILYELCNQYKTYQGGFFFKSLDDLRTIFDLKDKYPNVSQFDKKTIDVAYKELKEKYDAGQCDLWFEVKKEGRGKTSNYKFYVHTKENEEAQKETFKDLQQKAVLVYKLLLGYFKRDKKYCERIYKALGLNPDIATPVYEKLMKIVGTYKREEVAPVIRYVLKEDFKLK